MEASYGSEEAEAVREYVMTMPEGLHEHIEDFIALRMSLEEVQTFVETARRSGHTWWVSAVDESVLNDLDSVIGGARLKRGIRDGKEHVTTVKCMLSDEDKNLLRAEFVGVTDLNFVDGFRAEHVEHGRANALRTIASVQMRRMIPRGARVLEVGAKLEHSVAYGAAPGTYMGCMPVLDSSDAQRHAQGMRNVRLMLGRRGGTALKPNQRVVADVAVNSFDSMFTRLPVQEVTWPADFVMSLDANYDIPMADVPRVMHRVGARAWIGNLTRCEEAATCVVKRRGYMRVPGFDYVVDPEIDLISFHFRSSSKPYKHSLRVYREYMRHTTRTFRIGGSQYVYSVLPQTTSSMLMYAFHRVDDRAYADRGVSYLPTGAVGMLRVHTLQVSHMDRRGTELAPEYFDVSEDEFSRMLQDRMLAGRNVPDSDVIRAIRGARVGVMVNGVRVSTDTPLAFNLLKPMAVVLNVLAADMFQRGDADMDKARNAIRRGQYRSKGLWSAATGAFMDIAAGPGALVETVLQRLGAVVDRRSPGLKIERLPQFSRVDSCLVELGDDAHVYPPGQCVCSELAEAKSIARGDRGGLSEDERSVVARYVKVLSAEVCAAHTFDTSKVFNDEAEYSYDIKLPDGTSAASSTLVGGSDTSASIGSSDGESGLESSDDEEDEVFEDALSYGQQDFPQAEGFVRDAVEEYADIMVQQMEAADSHARVDSQVLTMGGVSARALDGANDGRVFHTILEVLDGVVVGSVNAVSDVQAYKRVYDYERGHFLDVRKVKGSRQAFLPRNTSRYVYTSSRFEIRNQPALLSACQRILRNPHVGPVVSRYKFVNGCFGSGKTSSIIKSYRTGDLYMSATRRSVDTVRKKLYAGSSVGERLVRTFDSAMIHGVERADRVLMDEVPMAHAGQVYALLEVIKPREVVMYGDFFQIPYVSFVAGCEPRYASVRGNVEIQMRMRQYRCRVSVCAAVLPFYGLDSGLSVDMTVEHIAETEEGFEYHKVDSMEQIPRVAGVKYVVCTQMTRVRVQAWLDAAGLEGNVEFSVVNTAHEVQGETYDEVIFIRDDTGIKPNSIYFSESHCLTTLTRARLRVRVYSMSREYDVYQMAYDASRNEAYRDIIRRNSV